MNGNPEIVEPEINEPVPAVVTESVENILDKIGSETEGVPLVYCMRVICGRFLLSGKPGELMSDRRVRVSVKSLALGNVASAVKLAPSLFLQKLQKTQGTYMFLIRFFYKCSEFRTNLYKNVFLTKL
jgi:huntingtin